MIVRDPVDCKECDTTYCQACAQEIISRRNRCPKKCSGNQILEVKKVNRFVKELLSEAKFKCDIG